MDVELDMRIKISIVVVLALSLFLAAVAVAGSPARQVSGGGELDLADRFYTVGLVVKIDGEGAVTGQGEFHSHGAQSWSSHWIPYCLSVNGDTPG
jgi:hypothetical protein